MRQTETEITNVPRTIWNGNLGHLQISQQERARVANALRHRKANLAMAATTLRGDRATLYWMISPGRGYCVDPDFNPSGHYAEVTWLAATETGLERAMEITRFLIAEMPPEDDIKVTLQLVQNNGEKTLDVGETADQIHLVSAIPSDAEYNKPQRSNVLPFPQRTHSRP